MDLQFLQVIRNNAKKSSAVALLIISGLMWQGCSSTNSSAISEPTANESSKASKVDNRLQCRQRQLVKQPGKNLFGVIEVGSSGVKGEVIQELGEPNKEGYTMEPRDEDIESEDVNPINPEAAEQTVAAVQQMFQEIQSRFSIPCEHIVIYGSSGFDSKSNPEHKAKLVQSIESTLGREFDIITPDQEATYTFNAVVPEHRLDQVLLVDVGSGNTKGAYLYNGNQKTLSVPWGTKSFTTRIDENRNGQDFPVAATDLKSSILVPAIATERQKKSDINTNSRIYLSGGITWAMSTVMQPCQPEQTINRKDELTSRFTKLSSLDIEHFYQKAVAGPDSLFAPDLSQCDAEQTEQVQQDLERIQTKVFTQDELIAGAEILRALSTELNFDRKDAIFFSRYAFEGLPIGYLKEKLNQSEA